MYGLLIGARETIPSFLQDIRKKSKLNNRVLNIIALTTIKFSVKILTIHLYGTQH
jgi:hypothetical protein